MYKVFTNYTGELEVLKLFFWQVYFRPLIIIGINFFELSVTEVKTVFNLRQVSLTAIVAQNRLHIVSFADNCRYTTLILKVHHGSLVGQSWVVPIYNLTPPVLVVKVLYIIDYRGL